MDEINNVIPLKRKTPPVKPTLVRIGLDELADRPGEILLTFMSTETMLKHYMYITEAHACDIMTLLNNIVGSYPKKV